jgi:4-hydroxy-3-polyprenylbenzoate decarboxylase
VLGALERNLPLTPHYNIGGMDMSYRDLHEFIDRLEREGELKRITTEVDPELEITQITDRVSKSYGPALLFENVKGSNMPVLINAFGSEKRMNMSLNVQNLDDIARDIMDILEIADK